MISTGAMLILATQGLTLAGAVVSIIQSLRNKNAIQEVHILVNAQFDDFKKETAKTLAASIAQAHAAGKAEGAAQQKADTDVKAASGNGG